MRALAEELQNARRSRNQRRTDREIRKKRRILNRGRHFVFRYQVHAPLELLRESHVLFVDEIGRKSIKDHPVVMRLSRFVRTSKSFDRSIRSCNIRYVFPYLFASACVFMRVYSR